MALYHFQTRRHVINQFIILCYNFFYSICTCQAKYISVNYREQRWKGDNCVASPTNIPDWSKAGPRTVRRWIWGVSTVATKTITALQICEIYTISSLHKKQKWSQRLIFMICDKTVNSVFCYHVTLIVPFSPENVFVLFQLQNSIASFIMKDNTMNPGRLVTQFIRGFWLEFFILFEF